MAHRFHVPEQRVEKSCGRGMGMLEMAGVAFIPVRWQWVLIFSAQSNDAIIVWCDLVVLGIILWVGAAVLSSGMVSKVVELYVLLTMGAVPG